MKQISETIDGSIKDIIQLKTLDASLEYSQMFDALEDTPREFQLKLVDALNSLGETMQVPPTEAFNKVLCKSDDKNEDVKKKLYNWWRAFFEVLGKCEKIPDDRKTEFNQKIDDLMAEIMKAGDAENTDEEEPVMESDDEDLGYQQATKDDEDKMLADMEFAIQHIGEVANKVKAVVNFINPYCGTEVNESGEQPKFKEGDIVKVRNFSGMDFYGRDAPIGTVLEIKPPHPDVGVYEYLILGRSGEFFAYEDELELVPERFTEENDIMDKPARYGIGDHVLYKGEECVVTDVDEDLRNDEEIYQVSRDSDKVDGLSFNDWATWDELEPLEGFTENIGKFNFHVGDKVKVVGRGLASKGWIGVVSSVDKSSPGLPYTVDFEGRESGEYAPNELAPAKGFTEEVKNTMKFKKIDERIGGGDSDEWVSMNDYIGEEFGESSLENELDKGDDGWTTIGQPVGEANDFITPEMKEKVREYVMQTWMASQGNDRNRISARDLYQLSKFLVNNHIKVSYGGISDDDSIRIDGEKVGEVVRNYSSRKVNGGYKELRPKIQWLDGGMVNEAKVVVDANDVWDVLELLDNDIAHTELTDLINSHLRTEEEIMDAINELCGETITKNELNTLLSGRMATLVDYLGLDVEEYENMGNFVDSGKPTSVELESRGPEETKKVSLYVDWDDDGAGLDRNVVIDVPVEIADSQESDALYDYISDWIDHQDFCVNDWAITDIEGLMDERSEDEIKDGEVKDGEKQVTQDGETKTLVAGEGENKKEMSDAEAATIMGGASATDMDAADIGVSSHEVADPYKKPVCEMTIEQEIDDPWKLSEMLWSQGKENLEDLLRSELVGEEDIMQMLEDSGLRNLTNINDAFAFDFPSILDSLGLDGEAWSQNLEFKRKDGED